MSESYAGLAAFGTLAVWGEAFFTGLVLTFLPGVEVFVAAAAFQTAEEQRRPTPLWQPPQLLLKDSLGLAQRDVCQRVGCAVPQSRAQQIGCMCQSWWSWLKVVADTSPAA